GGGGGRPGGAPPGPPPRLGLPAPEASHRGAGVTLDHALTLEQKSPERKSLRPRRADCRSDRAARSIETRMGGVGGHLGADCRSDRAARSIETRMGGGGGPSRG